MKLINRIRNNKLLYFLGVLIIGLLIILIVRITYAYLGASINEAKGNITLNSDDVDELKFDIGDPLSINATPTTLPENGENLVSSSTSSASLLANTTNVTAEYGYYVYFKISNNSFIYSDGSTPEIILTVKQGENEITNIEGLTYGTFNGVSGFDITTAEGLFNVASSYSITSNSSTNATVQEWTFTITYLNLGFDQSANFGNSMTTEVILKKDEYKTFANYIINDVYTADGENGLYYHDGVGTYTNADQEAGDNSYRYSGANPNNYVCFGSDAEACPDEYLYRIIGVFDDDSDGEYNVKLIKADYTTSAMLGIDGRDYYGNYDSNDSYYKGSMDTSTIAAYRWNYDTSVSSYGSNNWTTSELNKINLNINYITYLSNLWGDMIEDTTWHLGGMTSASSNTAKSFYTGERNNAGYGSNPTTYGPENANGNSTKIGLMYVSDYGYAAYPDAWATDIFDYDSSTIKQNNWLYMGLYEWTMVPYSSYSYFVFRLNDSGYLNNDSAYSGFSVRPVFYLKSNISYGEGNGTKDSPFRIAA